MTVAGGSEEVVAAEASARRRARLAKISFVLAMVLRASTSMGVPGGKAEDGAEGVLSCIGAGDGGGGCLAEAIGCLELFGSGSEIQA